MMWPVEKYSLEQLVQMFALRRGFEPLRADCQVSRTDGVDVSELMRNAVMRWYSSMLVRMPVEQLPVENVASVSRLAVMSDGSGSVELPQGCVRVGQVKLDSWMRSTEVVLPNHPLAAIQSNRWSRGSRHEPVAVWRGSRLGLYSPDEGGDSIALLEVVRMPGRNELFGVTEPMLAEIDDIELEGV